MSAANPRGAARRPAAADAGSARLTPATLEVIARIARDEAGLKLTTAKSAMIETRLKRRLRATEHTTFETYLRHLETKAGLVERRRMISALTTNVTQFFREAHHFEILAKEALPPLIAAARSGGRVRIWSAGGATGEEAYSIAITLLDLAPEAPDLDIRILSTDINPSVLSVGKAGRYSLAAIAGLSPRHRRHYFEISQAPGTSHLEICAAARQLVAFRELNLLDSWPMRRPFDIIFCRNVMIYFDREVRLALWPRFCGQMDAGGWMFLGHSERVAGPASSAFSTAGLTVYRKDGGRPSAADRGQG